MLKTRAVPNIHFVFALALNSVLNSLIVCSQCANSLFGTSQLKAAHMVTKLTSGFINSASSNVKDRDQTNSFYPKNHQTSHAEKVCNTLT